MKKLYTLLTSVAIGIASLSTAQQTTVTYMVDVTPYVAVTPIGPNGLRLGGNFAATGGMNGALPMADWSDTDPSGAMTDMGNNIWGISVTYPSTTVGTQQLFKFINSNWGTNEGSAASSIASGGCGVDDGGGNINRTLDIPASNVAYQFCWELCTKCDGSPALVTSSINNISSVASFNVYPNPVSETATITYSLSTTSTVSMEILNAIGQRISTTDFGKQNPGTFANRVGVAELAEGIYFVRLNVSGKSTTYRMSVVK